MSPGRPAAINSIPTEGTPGALGDTYHGLVNVLYSAPKTPVFDSASLLAELTWMHWAKVTQNAAVFKGRESYTGIDKPSRDYVGLAVNFTPTWFQVLPGMDLLAPVTYSRGLNGNAAVFLGGNEAGGNYSVGVAADLYSKYRIDLKYTGYFGDYSTNPATGAATGFNGVFGSLADRGWVSLTFKTTF